MPPCCVCFLVVRWLWVSGGAAGLLFRRTSGAQCSLWSDCRAGGVFSRETRVVSGQDNRSNSPAGNGWLFTVLELLLGEKMVSDVVCFPAGGITAHERPLSLTLAQCRWHGGTRPGFHHGLKHVLHLHGYNCLLQRLKHCHLQRVQLLFQWEHR